MGSGESDATAGSNNETKTEGPPAQAPKRDASSSSKKQNELERPVQPGLEGNKSTSDKEEVCEEDEDDEVWMFKTFTGKKTKGDTSQKNSKNQKRLNNQSENPNQQHDLDGGLGFSYEDNSNNSPFDMEISSDIRSQ